MSDQNTDQKSSSKDTETTEVSKPGLHNLPPVPNPYGFPDCILFRGLMFNGAPVIYGPIINDPMTQVKTIRALPMREDDIIIAAFPKCGTHWVNEISHMLTCQTTSFAERTKEFTMLEFINDFPALEQNPSPRLLNSHLYMAHLPEQIVEKKVKIIHIVRNPKDTAVSAFHHLKQSAYDHFSFDNFLKGATTENHLTISNQFNFLCQMAEFEKEHPDHPIIHVHFEDLKKKSVPTIQSLSKFLGVTASESFCQEIATACGFDKMKEVDDIRDMPEHLTKSMPSGKKLFIYRKGIVGDWKNTFTVAQNEMFDDFIRSQGEQPYKFRDFE